MSDTHAAAGSAETMPSVRCATITVTAQADVLDELTAMLMVAQVFEQLGLEPHQVARVAAFFADRAAVEIELAEDPDDE